jgi:Leucine-rich repeat (LRR) protein
MEEAQRRITRCIQNRETTLDISYLDLKELPNNLPNNLTELYCYNNKITKLENLPDNLTELDCDNNKITKLENLPRYLTYLKCSNNMITKLENLPNNSIKLYCFNNKYLHISKKYAQKFRLKEIPNYEKYILKIQKFWKKRKILKFMKSQTSHQIFDIPDLHKLITIYL